MSKLVYNTKTSLAEEAKQYVPKIRELYPNLDNMLVDRISKYCVVYSDGTDDGSIEMPYYVLNKYLNKNWMNT